jgi:NAD dependent epimerase/dehydratase family enzyme
MNILMTGGTGLIGRRLCADLLRQGHQLTVLSRQPATVARLCGQGVTAMDSLDAYTPDRVFDAVINLAGEPIIGARWTAARKARLRESRIFLTECLVQKMREARVKPAVFLSGSAIGVR